MSLDFIYLGMKNTRELGHSRQDKYHHAAYLAFVGKVLMSANVGVNPYRVIVYTLQQQLVIFLNGAKDIKDLCLHSRNTVASYAEL